MVKYKCITCCRLFNKKYSYNRHLNRKFPCKKLTPANTELHRHENTGKHICNYCNKTYTRLFSLNRHLNDRCHIKNRENEEKGEIYKQLVNQMQEMQKQNKKTQRQNKKLIKEIGKLKKKAIVKANKNCNNNSNNITNIDKQQNNITNIDKQQNINITLNAHGREDMEFLTETNIKNILLHGCKAVEKLIKTVHFDKNIPNNHNIYIPSIKDTHVMIYDGKDWVLTHKDSIVRELYDSKSDYLIDKYDKLSDTLDERTNKTFGRFKRIVDNEQSVDRIRKDIKLILYNNREIPKKTMKKFKSNQTNMIDNEQTNEQCNIQEKKSKRKSRKHKKERKKTK